VEVDDGVAPGASVGGAAASRIFTVGHGARSAEQFLAVLSSASIGGVVDVRRFPGSRRHPHFGRDALARLLEAHHVSYRWWGEELGGRRSSLGVSRHAALTNRSFRSFADHMDSEQFAAGLARLERHARDDPPVAIMCAETPWWRCHRMLIADALVVHGVEVVHLLDTTGRHTHRLHAAARADAEGRPLYDVGALPWQGPAERS
jgi:uncharacterized protein (DUF488 family)